VLKIIKNGQMSFATLAHPVEGLILDALLTSKVEKSLICLVGIWKPTVSITTPRLISSLKMLT
jgi:hypothetical protein